MYLVCLLVLEHGRTAVAKYCNYKSNQITTIIIDCMVLYFRTPRIALSPS